LGLADGAAEGRAAGVPGVVGWPVGAMGAAEGAVEGIIEGAALGRIVGAAVEYGEGIPPPAVPQAAKVSAVSAQSRARAMAFFMVLTSCFHRDKKEMRLIKDARN
jgi:hypothetical protein